MPKLVPKRGVEQPTRIQPIPTVEKKYKIPPVNMNLKGNTPETIGFSTSRHEGGWKIIDRFSKVLEQQPTFDDYGVARAYADAMNDEVTKRRFNQ